MAHQGWGASRRAGAAAPDFALARAAFALRVVAKWSPLVVVALAAAGGLLLPAP